MFVLYANNAVLRYPGFSLGMLLEGEKREKNGKDIELDVPIRTLPLEESLHGSEKSYLFFYEAVSSAEVNVLWKRMLARLHRTLNSLKSCLDRFPIVCFSLRVKPQILQKCAIPPCSSCDVMLVTQSHNAEIGLLAGQRSLIM